MSCRAARRWVAERVAPATPVRHQRVRLLGHDRFRRGRLRVLTHLIHAHQGHETDATPEGVAYATTRTVVVSSLAVLGMDFILTALMFSTP